MAIGATNLVATLLAMTVIDKLGRKKLLLFGSVGTAICLAGVAAVFFTNSHQALLVWLLVAYIAFFAVSQGAVIWVYISEVFPTKVRSKGQSLGSSSHWIMNAAIAFTFPLLAKSSGAYPFVFFAAMMVLQFFVVLFSYPGDQRASLWSGCNGSWVLSSQTSTPSDWRQNIRRPDSRVWASFLILLRKWFLDP